MEPLVLELETLDGVLEVLGRRHLLEGLELGCRLELLGGRLAEQG